MKRNAWFLITLCLLYYFALYAPILAEEGEIYEGVPIAFGDFNSDKLTDLFVIQEDGRRFEIVRQLWYSDLLQFSTTPNLRCSLHKDSHEVIVGLIPSDFTGNAMMDVLLVMKNASSPETFNLRLLKGNKSSIDCDPLEQEPFANGLRHQPLLLDLNGDAISDILAQDNNLTYLVWYGSHSGFGSPKLFPMDGTVDPNLNLKLRNPSSNAFVNLNEDRVADIFLDGEGKFEYWYADKSGYKKPSLKANYPNHYSFFGRSSFADINSDAIIDHILPFCSDISCGISAFNRSSNSFETIFSAIKIDSKNYIFYGHPKYGSNPFPISLRAGDMNADGYPDFITVMHPQNNKNDTKIIVFINVPTNDNSFSRTFHPTIFTNESNIPPEIAAFFDLKEDGQIDVIFAGYKFNSSRYEMKISYIKNTKFIDSNFVKILITSGLCPGSCYDESEILTTYKVPYGTNKAGPFISYWLKDANSETVTSCGAQLSQSTDFSLQMPYNIFGLGKFANYIEELYVTLPTGNTTKVFTRMLEQIVPDSQLVVIPHPINKPRQWISRLFVKPSQIIFKVLYTLLGICAGLFLIIAILHRREHLKDLAELEDFKQVMPGRRR